MVPQPSESSLAALWREEPLGGSTTANVTAGVTQSRSAVRVTNFASADEVSLLVAAGEDAAQSKLQNPLSSNETRCRVEVLGRRLSVGRLPGCDPIVQELALQLVQRAIAFVQTELPGLADAVGLAQCTPETRLSYSEGEPGINVYTAPGGDFKPHRDAQALTLLVSLTTHGLDYEGGGTAFYEPSATPADAIRGKAKPVSVLRPPAGTALLWGGELTHAAEAVIEGRRLVFVASFTPCSP